MTKKSYHIIAKSDGRWSLTRTGDERALKNFSNKSQAIKDAGNMLKKFGGGELIIHTPDGRVSYRSTFGSNSSLHHKDDGNERYTKEGIKQ
jgi:hypothetical protein